MLTFFDAVAPKPAAVLIPEVSTASLNDLVLPPIPGTPPPPTVEGNGVAEHGPALQVAASASGEKAKALDILDALRTLQGVERERRLPDQTERRTLARFGGFGPVALSLFPDPVSGSYKGRE